MSKYLSGAGVIFSGDPLRTDEAVATHNLGDLLLAHDGRKFRYALAGGTALVVGNLQQAAAEDTVDQNITPTAASIGALSVVTSSTMTVTANQYAQGWMIVSVTPGVGYQYAIAGHAAYTAAAATFELLDPIQVALTTTSRVDFVSNPYRSVIVNPITATSCPAGVAVNNITASQYGWIQTGGVATILADGVQVVGAGVVASNLIAGAIEDVASTTQAIVGTCVTGIADTEYGAVYLLLD